VKNVSLLVARKKDWALTSEAFERLLASLDANREHAGQKYETLRRKLIEFFEARGSRSPTDHADEAINRVARRVEEGESVQDLNRYSYGVARLLFMETLRARETEPIAVDLAQVPPILANGEERERRREEQERRLECLEVCLSKLAAANRACIIEYYREERGVKIEHRKRQAEKLNMSLNALRLRASRLRAELGDCINSCLSRSSPDTKSVIYH
jgi:DNA-directed RNA polymerase specialized sigma24 family protein